MTPAARTRAVFLACLLLPLLIYARTLHAPFFFDDRFNVVENPGVRSWPAFLSQLTSPDKDFHARVHLSRPLTFATFVWNFSTGGLDPLGYRLFNLAVHGLTAFAVFLLTNLFLKRVRFQNGFRFALAAALLFAAHPLATEVVAYVSNRSDGLCVLFFVAALLLFDAGVERDRCSLHVWALLSFALAFAAKQTAVVFPAVLMLYDAAFLGQGWQGVWSRRRSHFPFWIAALIFVGFHYSYAGQSGVWADQASLDWTRLSYIRTQPWVILRYIGLTIWPTNLCADHWVKPLAWTDPRLWIGAAGLTVLLYAAARLWKSGSVSARLFAFGLGWALLTLAPTSSLVPVSDAMAERRMYLPLAGLCAAWCAAAAHWAGERLGRLRALAFSAGLSLLFFSAATWVQAGKYLQPFLLWEDAVRQYPDNHRAQNNLGLAFQNMDRMADAESRFLESLRLYPRSPDSWVNLGKLYHDAGLLPRALALYEKALSLHPDHAPLAANLGSVYRDMGRWTDAEKFYVKALQLDPSLWATRENLGLLYVRLRRPQPALAALKEAVAAAPDFADGWRNLGLFYYEQKDYNNALQCWRRALELNPQNNALRLQTERLERAVTTRRTP